MIFGIDLTNVTAGILMVAASACPPATRVTVDVQMTHAPLPVVKNITSQELTQRMQTEKTAANADMFTGEAHWMVGGLNRAVIKTGFRMPYAKRTDPKTGMVCFMPQSFEYIIAYENTIHIAEDFRHMGCRYSATMAHEKRHEKADVRILQDYAADAKKVLEKAVSGLRPQGPYPADRVDAEYERLTHDIAESLKPLYQKMMTDRREKHAAIDSYENYMRDTALCPDQFPTFDPAKE